MRLDSPLSIRIVSLFVHQKR